MTMAIAHAERDIAVLDVVREVKPPFVPSSVCTEFSEVMKAYGISRAQADKWGSEFVRERFKDNGIIVEPCEKTKSALYTELLPALSSGKLRLVDNKRLVSQMCGLERRAARSGRENIEHPPGAHDDVANAVAGAAVLARDAKRGIFFVTDEILEWASRPAHHPSASLYRDRSFPPYGW
jgi:hypothetical protein